MVRKFKEPLLVPPLRFFKVVMPSVLATKILKIPPEFAKNHLSELSGVVTLSNPAGRNWVVRLEKKVAGVWFGEGWFEFVEYHSICEGHFLVFGYQGNSKFVVRIFDKTACEIDYPCNQQETNDDDDKKDDMKRKWRSSLKPDVVPNSAKRVSSLVKEIEEVIEVSESCGLDLPSRKRRHRTGKIGQAFFQQKDQIKKRRVTDATDNDVIEILETDDEEENIYISRKDVNTIQRVKTLKLKRPSFVVLLKGHNFASCRVYIPFRFTRRYFKKSTNFINIRDPRQRKWRVNLSVERSKYYRLTNGWSELSEEIGLKVGDICVFELIKMNTSIGLKLFIVGP